MLFEVLVFCIVLVSVYLLLTTPNSRQINQRIGPGTVYNLSSGGTVVHTIGYQGCAQPPQQPYVSLTLQTNLTALLTDNKGTQMQIQFQKGLGVPLTATIQVPQQIQFILNYDGSLQLSLQEIANTTSGTLIVPCSYIFQPSN
jgi:hypothetical protein